LFESNSGLKSQLTNKTQRVNSYILHNPLPFQQAQLLQALILNTWHLLASL